jgi:transposase-like protein
MGQHFLLSPSAKNLSLEDVDRMSDHKVWQFFVEHRWGPQGKDGTQVCPCCGVVAKHYFVQTRKQWRCREIECGRMFSVTSGTKFADHKLPLKKILKAMVLYLTAVKGISASQLARTLGVRYMTAFTLLHKLRETLLVTRDTDPMSSLVHVDGAHVSGWPRKARVKKKSSKTWKAPREADVSVFHPNRRIVMVVREVHLQKGLGGRRTVVEVCSAEDRAAATKLASRYIEPGTTIMTDEHPAYAMYAVQYRHLSVNHGVEYATTTGVSNNQAENFFLRMRRLIIGQVHRVTPKYMLDYANEVAWREDARRWSSSQQVEHLLQGALRTGESLWWRGYWQGRHREGEILFA